jgi:hypothetical protein
MIQISKKKARNIAIVASAHKVGSTWLINILKKAGIYESSIVPEEFRANIHNPGLLNLTHPAVNKFLLNEPPGTLFKSHSFPPKDLQSDKVRIINIYRDPRDVIISNIFYLANLDPKKGGWPELKEMDLKERMKLFMQKTRDHELLKSWYDYSGAYHITYEDMLKNSYKVMKRVFDYLNVDYNKKKLKELVNEVNFEKLSKGRKRGVEDRASFFRKGIAGDWQNHFTNEIVEFFVNQKNGIWNKLLVKLGYEKHSDWQFKQFKKIVEKNASQV